MSDDGRPDPHRMQPARTRQHNWARWLPDPILTAPEPEPARNREKEAEERAVSLRTRLSELRQQAAEQGRTEGHADGYAAGLEQGLADGQKRGYDEGYRAGFDAGQAEGRDDARQAATRLTALASECAVALTQVEADMGHAMISLSVRIAEQVLRSTLSAQPEKLLDIIADIVRLDPGKSAALQLYVNPADLELVRSYLNDDPDTRLWRVVADDSITAGGCKARTALGDIDATLETRWQRVVSTLGGVV